MQQESVQIASQTSRPQSLFEQYSGPVACLELHVGEARSPAKLLGTVVLDALGPHFWTALAVYTDGLTTVLNNDYASCSYLVFKLVAKMAHTPSCQSFPCCLLCAGKEHLQQTHLIAV